MEAEHRAPAEGGVPVMRLVGSHAWCLYQGDKSWRDCEIIATSSHETTKEHKYYIHFIEFNRRMDRWVLAEELKDDNPVDASAQLTAGHLQPFSIFNKTQGLKKTDVVEFVEEEYDEETKIDFESILEHEEVTKVKNVNFLEIGRFIIEVWYFSPIPKEFYPNGHIETLFSCAFCLSLFKDRNDLLRHYSLKKCSLRHPPGNEIYRDEEKKVSVFEVDGNISKTYCQNLSYIGKLFLDHKTLHFDVDPFLFYIFCEFDKIGFHIVGFFSKEKYSENGFNLACILTLPPFQKKGYGKFLIEFSYELSKREKKVGSPEKPLSDLGQISYRVFWSKAILTFLLNFLSSQNTPTDSQTQNSLTLSVMDICSATSIKSEDVILTLNYLNLLKVLNGRHVFHFTKEILEKKLFEVTKGRKDIFEFKSEKLHWTPLVFDSKKDKWSISNKLNRKTLEQTENDIEG